MIDIMEVVSGVSGMIEIVSLGDRFLLVVEEMLKDSPYLKALVGELDNEKIPYIIYDTQRVNLPGMSVEVLKNKIG